MQLKNSIQVELSDIHQALCIFCERKIEEPEMGAEVMQSKAL
uniref:Uncharacterized protein n=1 Tax=Arundo donax TaxID=35708 RepID=A0A0A9C1G6_ARUDO